MKERLPNRIRELRNARGWNLSHLAAALECSVTQVSDLETGKRQLTQHWAVRIARVFEVGAPDLFPPEEGGSPLSAEEMRLLALYRQADEAQREQLVRMAEIIATPHKSAAA